uniref:Ovule protein n=1 Tax=Panagrellus redivivus TaxID=6233 RepID=A0A7E4VRK8_PANRE
MQDSSISTVQRRCAKTIPILAMQCLSLETYTMIRWKSHVKFTDAAVLMSLRLKEVTNTNEMFSSCPDCVQTTKLKKVL